MGLDGVDTSDRRAKAEGHGDASASGWVGSQSGLHPDQTPLIILSCAATVLWVPHKIFPSEKPRLAGPVREGCAQQKRG